MKVAYFPGCKANWVMRPYDVSTRLVLDKLGVELVEPGFDCCGHPARDVHFRSFVGMSGRNLALAAKTGLDILVNCQCCFGSLKMAEFVLRENEEIRRDLDGELARDGLEYKPGVRVHHLLTFLHDRIGVDKVKEAAVRPFGGLSIGAHYGCHIQRPSHIVETDHPVRRRVLESLIEAVGGKCPDWPGRIDCCGGPVLGRNDDLARRLMINKVAGARVAGAAYIGVACPCCHIQFDGFQHTILGDEGAVPSVLYPQLLGMAMGFDPAELGVWQAEYDLSRLVVSRPDEEGKIVHGVEPPRRPEQDPLERKGWPGPEFAPYCGGSRPVISKGPSMAEDLKK